MYLIEIIIGDCITRCCIFDDQKIVDIIILRVVFIHYSLQCLILFRDRNSRKKLKTCKSDVLRADSILKFQVSKISKRRKERKKQKI